MPNPKQQKEEIGISEWIMIAGFILGLLWEKRQAIKETLKDL